jgi:hypothetical protein
LALQRPFLHALPHMSKQLSCLSDDRSAHAAVIRQVSAHLRAGGAALSFPAGRIEPDPNVHEGAASSLETWARSAGMFVRLAPETAILPIVVRGVVWPKLARRWRARHRQVAQGEDKAAAALQLLANVVLKIRPVRVSVEIGRPVYAHELGTTKSPALHQAVLAEMSRMILNSPHCEGTLDSCSLLGGDQ